MHQIERDLAALQKRDLHQPPFDRQRSQILLDIGSADHVEDHIDTASASRLLENRYKILASVVDRPLGAEFDADRAFLRRPGGREDARSECLRELDRGRADAAGPAM